MLKTPVSHTGGHLVALFAGKVVIEVEYYLLPVSLPDNSDKTNLTLLFSWAQT